MSEKIYDEAHLRSLVRAKARRLYETRWGALTDADTLTLDVERWQAAWERGKVVEKQAGRHLADVSKSLRRAAEFLDHCRTAPRGVDVDAPLPPGYGPAPEVGLPMGKTAQVLGTAVPLLLKTLDAVRSARITINPAERPERRTWLMQRIALTYYEQDDEKLAAADRQELAVLSLLGGWWPPKATGRNVTMRGMIVDHVIALEADLMHRARTAIATMRRELEESPFAKKLAAGLMAVLLDARNNGTLSPPGTAVPSLRAQGAPRGHRDTDRPSQGPRHRRPRGV